MFMLSFFLGACLEPGFHGGANWSGASFDPALPALWIACEVLGARAVMRRGTWLRESNAVLALVDLVLPTFFFSVFFPLHNPDMTQWLVVRLIACVVGGMLILALWHRRRLPDWFLPVRGIHARQFIGGLAILLPLGAGPLGFATWLTVTGAQPRPPWWAWIVMAGLPCYFGPLWDVLVRGWSPAAADRALAPARRESVGGPAVSE